MKPDKKELAVNESLMQDLMFLKEELKLTMLNESEAMQTIVSNMFTRIAYYLKGKEIESKQTGMKELEAYESIMQNILTLKEKLVETRLNQMNAVQNILHTVSAMQDSENESGALSSVNIPPTEDTESILSIGRGNLTIYAN